MADALTVGTATSFRQCDREGCDGRTRGDRYCSLLCTEIDRRLAETRALIAEIGISPLAAALWAAAVSLSDQLSEVDRLEGRLRTSAAVG